MPDRKLTNNEIIKALECCKNCESCDYETTDCPLGKEMECRSILAEYALDLINRLQAEKQDLEIELKAMRGSSNSYKAENERLKNTIAVFTNNAADFANEIDRHKKDKEDAFQFAADIVNAEKIVVAQAKAEAYKEFADRLKIMFRNGDEVSYYEWLIHYEVDNLLKELVGDTKC